MSEHTPTPWKVHPRRQLPTVVGDEDTSRDGRYSTYRLFVDISSDNAQEDAEFIVRAVNAHDALLAAAEAAIDPLAASYFSFESDNPNNPLRGVCGECNQPWHGLDTLHQGCSATKYAISIKQLRAAIAQARGDA